MTETLQLNPDELREYIVKQTIDHGLEVENLKKEIKSIKEELIGVYKTILNNGYHKIGERKEIVLRMAELERK